MAEITVKGGKLYVKTPYSTDFVDRLKAFVPAPERAWDKQAKVWVVAQPHLNVIQTIIQDVYGSSAGVTHDMLASTQAAPETKSVLLEYIGRVKDTGYATGYANDSWSLLFSEKVLRGWFEDNFQTSHENNSIKTLYSVIGAQPDDDSDALKRMWRRACFTWHPDKNSDPDAPERFKEIQAAYDLLRDPYKRAKYDAGLKYLVSQPRQPSTSSMSKWGYATPVRCGKLVVTGLQGIKYFDVSKIHSWDDDVRQMGQYKLTRVATWKRGDDQFTTEWQIL